MNTLMTPSSKKISDTLDRVPVANWLPAPWRIPAIVSASLLLLLGIYYGFFHSSGVWWNSAWHQRLKITLDIKSAGINENIRAGQVLIRLHDGVFAFSSAKEDGSDLRAVAADNKTALPLQVEKIDSLLGEAFVWVGVPEQKVEEPGTVWLYFGNAQAEFETNREVYDPETVLVYHFSDKNKPVQDSSGKGNHADSQGVAAEGAMIGGGARFEGAKALTIPSSASMTWAAGDPLTWMAWIKPSALQPNTVIYSQRESGQGIAIGVDTDVAYVEVSGPGGVQRSARVGNAAVTAGAWRHVAVVYAENKWTVYLNGEALATLNAPLPALSGAAKLGADTNTAGGYTGDLDEVVIAKAARTPGWIKFAAKIQGATEKDSKLMVISQDSQGGSQEHGYFGVILRSVTFDGWVVIGLLMIMGIFSWYVMYKKVSDLNRIAEGNEAFLKEWREVVLDLEKLDHGQSEDQSPKGRVTDRNKLVLLSPLYHIYHIGLNEIRHRQVSRGANTHKYLSTRSIEAIRATLDGGQVREIEKLNSLLVFLTISIAGGPFLGLLGTVVGVMITFAAIAAAGDVNVNAIAPGIAAALVATVAGLGVAIPALFGYNYILSRVKTASNDMRVFVDEFVTRMAELYDADEE